MKQTRKQGKESFCTALRDPPRFITLNGPRFPSPLSSSSLNDGVPGSSESGLSCISLFLVPGYLFHVLPSPVVPVVTSGVIPKSHLQPGSVNTIAHETSLLVNHTGISGSSCPKWKSPPFWLPPPLPRYLYSSFHLHFSKYYPVVKLSNPRLSLDSLIQSVSKPFDSVLLPPNSVLSICLTWSRLHHLSPM